MASPHVPNISAVTGQKRITTYGGESSRKRPLSAKTQRDLEPRIPFKSKLEQPINRLQSSRPSGSNQTPCSDLFFQENPLGSVSLSRGSSPQGVPLRKRDHSAAFGTETMKDQSQWRKQTIEPVSKPSVFTSDYHGTTADARTKTTSSRRPRLIDALAAQRETIMGANDVDSDDAESDSSHTAPDRRLAGLRHKISNYNVRLLNVDRRGTTPTNRKVKHTYSQSRTTVGESQTSDVFDSSIKGMVSPRLASPRQADAFAMDDLDGGDSSQPAIKSVHELRRAGANNRFADEMDDLISRIGSPSTDACTMRRNALCELVQKLQRKDFMRQFRDHASRDTVARNIGKETDPISGFALIAALLCFLTSGPAPNLLRQLAKDGVGRFLARLLYDDEDIAILAVQKKLNMSRTSRASIGDAKIILQRLPIWHGYQPVDISPRTAALQLMALLSERADAALLDQILLESQRAIIAVATWASERGSSEDIDYALTIFTLQTQSSAGVTPRLNSDGGHSKRISRLLLRAIRHWPTGQIELGAAILKLALNTTNTEDEAGAFNNPHLSARLFVLISELFVSVDAAIRAERLDSGKYNELLLMLGVMINIMEHCPPARRVVDENAIDKLMSFWESHQQVVSEADSENKVKLTVAVGYLSVLLGYMCLTRQAREQLKNRVGEHALHYLRGSIQQFVHLYRVVDSKVHALDALVEELKQVA